MKLRTEDFDIVESEVDLGIIDYRGGSIGPGVITIENFFNEVDVDGDNGRDQNGNIQPVHTSGSVNNLRVRVQPLLGPGVASIPSSAFRSWAFHGESRLVIRRSVESVWMFQWTLLRENTAGKLSFGKTITEME